MSKIVTFMKLMNGDHKQAKMALMRNIGKSKLSHIIPDKMYLKLQHRLYVGCKLDLKNPKTFNEKLQWLKLYNRNPEYSVLVDKYEVKKYIADTIGEQYVIPTLGIWNSVEEIDFNLLPNQFVLKCTHDSGSTIVCKDKSSFDIESAKSKLSQKMKLNMFWWGREWPYKNVKPRIIAEAYMEDPSTSELRDYKFFCFNGVSKALFIATDRQDATTETKFDFFDMEFNHIDVRNGHPNADKQLAKPQRFDEMITLAEKLSTGFPHLRVDFYEVDGKIYFGELTFYHWSGLVPFEPKKWDYKFGEWIELPKDAQKTSFDALK